MTAAPFLKWAGGKRQLLPRILPLVPKKVGTYYEPFLGGGALFFSLANAGRFERAELSDLNPELVITYQAIQRDVEAVIACLGRYRDSRRAYLRARAARPIDLPAVEIAARMIFLNRCGFNGLYRVNASGEFNVPYGSHKRRRPILDPEILRAASRALHPSKVTVSAADFLEATRDVGAGDFVYFDPPYVPLSKTSSFSTFTAGGFGFDEQDLLADRFDALRVRGATVVLSNSDCQLTRFLYRSQRVVSVPARRAINSVASRRGPVRELLVVAR